MGWHFSFCISIRRNLWRRECSVQGERISHNVAKQRSDQETSCEGLGSLDALPSQGSTERYLHGDVTYKPHPSPREGTLRNGLFHPSEQPRGRMGREWTLRGTLKKTPSDVIVAGGETPSSSTERVCLAGGIH